MQLALVAGARRRRLRAADRHVPRAEAPVAAGRRHRPRRLRRRRRRPARSTSGPSGPRWSRPSPARSPSSGCAAAAGPSGDLALALFFYSGIAGGVVLTGLAGSLNAGTLTYLFGSILTVDRGDAVTIAVLGARHRWSVVVVVAGPVQHRARRGGGPRRRPARRRAQPRARRPHRGHRRRRHAGRRASCWWPRSWCCPSAPRSASTRSFRATLLARQRDRRGSARSSASPRPASGRWRPGGTIVLVAAAAFALVAIGRAGRQSWTGP